MIKPVDAKPGTGMTYDTSLSPAPAPTSLGESVAAPAEVGQVMGTYPQSEQARYLQKCRVKLDACIRRYGPFSKEVREANSYCMKEAGYLISGESAFWGYA